SNMQIYDLIYFLKQCPEDFLQNWENQQGGKNLTEILVKDTYRKIYGKFDVADYALPISGEQIKTTENHRLSIQISCWFFSYAEFQNKPYLLPEIQKFLMEDLLQ